MPINKRVNSSARSSFDPTDETINNSNNINTTRHNSRESEGSDIGVKHFKYNPETNKLEGNRAIETTLNSLFLGEQHKMSSGSENIYFTNLTSQIDWYPVWGGIKDQSVLANRDMSGVINPTGRVFSDYGELNLGGNAVNGTSIAYDGDNYFPYNISGMGITTRVSEDVPSNIRLKYELSVNGTPVYVQILEHNGLSINDDLTWYFGHPLDIVAGQTNHASITKIDPDDNDIGFLMVCKGDDGGGRYQTRVFNRLFQDKNIAFTEDLESIDVIGFYDIYVDPTFSGESTGTNIAPYKTIEEAVNASSSGDKVFVKGIVNVSDEIELAHSLNFYGIDGTEIRYASYNSSNANIFKFSDSSNTQEFTFRNIKFSNAGEYGLKIVGAASVNITDCIFTNNGWSGYGLNTIISSSASGVEGYDSNPTDLQSFYSGANASNGGAMRIENSTTVRIIGNTVSKNLRGIRVQDCGIGGVGFITRNVSTQNIESGIYLAAGPLGGCQNITSAINVSSYNANNGLLCIGGINNKFSQNEVNGNWNAGLCNWGSANLTLRDCGLYDNNRSQYNGIGNTGDARASIQINDASTYLANTFSWNPSSRFLMEVLDTQVHYTGLGSSSQKIGFFIGEELGDIPNNDKNIIKIDDVGFIGQDYAIDFSEVDLTNLRVSLGDNSYQQIGIKTVNEPLNGNYFELPFSNHSMNLNEVDFSVTNTGNIEIKEGVGGTRLNPYNVNELRAEPYGSDIQVILKDSNKIQFIVPVSGCSIDGSMVNSVLSQALVQLNDLFTNTTGFASGGNPVTSFALTGNDLTLTLQDGTSYTTDVTTLGVDENKFVSSGALNGSNLELTMNDSSVITIDASNMINGSSLPAIANNWYIAYGNNSGDEIEAASIVAAYENKQPFYNGDFLGKGEEYVWTHDNNGTYILGVYSGAEETSDELEITYNAKWSQNFKFSRSNGTVRETSVGVDIASRYASGYNINNNTVFSLRYGNDNYLYLYDISNPIPVLIGKSNTTLVGDSVTIFMGGENQPNAKFPVMTKRMGTWTIVADFDDSENGEWADGIEMQTIIKSNLELESGYKFVWQLPESGNNRYYGIGYTGAATGESDPVDKLVGGWRWHTSEVIQYASDWTLNTSNSNYDDTTFGVPYWYNRDSGGGITVSYRYNTNNVLEMWDEDLSELIMTYNSTLDGSAFHLFYGATSYASPETVIPNLSVQQIGQGSQPITDFAPNISNQSFDITEGEAFNIQIALDANSDIVNQYGEEDAPNWAVLNQATGVFNGTAPVYNGSTDSYVINCKAANAIGGVISFQITLNVQELTYTNTKSLFFEDGVSSYLGGNAALVTSMERGGNGTGASDAWSISLWVKGSTANSGQTVFYFGNNDVVNNGHIELRQTNHNGAKRLRLRYGSNGNHLQFTTPSGSITPNSWQHVLVTYDGGETGVASGSMSTYYGAFKIYIDGVLQTTSNTHSNYGYSGSVVGQNFRFGRFASGTYPKDMVYNQIAIWDSDQSSNVPDIYNGGATQDLSLLTDAPEHYYEIENNTTTIQDLIGTVHLVGYNFNSGDLIDDAP